MERVRGHAENEGNADVPNCRGSRYHGHEPLALVVAYSSATTRLPAIMTFGAQLNNYTITLLLFWLRRPMTRKTGMGRLEPSPSHDGWSAAPQ